MGHGGGTNFHKINAPSTAARLACDETTARRIAAYLGEILDAEETACAAFEDDGGRWQVAVHFRAAPDQARLRGLVELAAGPADAHALGIPPGAPPRRVAPNLARPTPGLAGRGIL